MIRAALAWAPANLALVKYWGKRDAALNLPATSSLSATLGLFGSEAKIVAADTDVLDVQGDPGRALRVIEAARALTGNRAPLDVVVRNTVPTAVGLASSASSMAALALALSRALAFEDSPVQTARLARLGSGSAIRSLFGGFVEWDAGIAADGSDCRARTAFPSAHLPLAIRVAVTAGGPKEVSSGEAMERCRRTSPSYVGFVRDNPAVLEAARSALADRDIARLGGVAEAQSMQLHEILREASPPIDLLRPASRDVLAVVSRLRERGVPCFFTIDAGPSVAVFVDPRHGDAVGSALAAIPGVVQVLEDAVGAAGARFLEEGR
jgi:diphosphomevalonate decarboxylase